MCEWSLPGRLGGATAGTLAFMVGGEEAAVEPEVEPNDVERNREGQESTNHLTPRPEGEDSEEVYDHHHI
jgi:hypothetical protein